MENDLLILEREYQIRVYSNFAGDITIEQENPPDEEVSTVVLTKSQAEKLYLALKELIERQ